MDPLQPENTPPPGRSPNAEAALTNRTGVVLPPEQVADAGSAMDDLFKSELGRDPNILDNVADKDREKIDAEIKTASEIPDLEEPAFEDPDAKAAADKEAADKAAKEAADKAAAEKLANEPGKKDFLDDLLPDTGDKPKETPPVPDKPKEDPYDTFKVRSDASEKTKETFESLKKSAREREQKALDEAAKRKEEAETLRKEVEELRKKTVPDDVLAELKDHREFRAAFDAEHDPEFVKKFDSRRQTNETAVFEMLKKNGLKDELIDAVKKLPYDQKVDQIARWAEKLSPREKLLITGHLADNERLEADKQAALAEVKEKAEKILAEKKAAPDKSKEQFAQEIVVVLKPILPRLPFLHERTIPDAASPKEKAEIEKHNAEAAAAQKLLLGFLQDDTARTRGVLAVTGLLAPRYRAEAQALKARVTELEKELGDIRDAGRLSKTARSAAEKERSPGVNLDINADEALEEAWKKMGGGA